MDGYTQFILGVVVVLFIAGCAGAAKRQVATQIPVSTPDPPLIDQLLAALNIQCSSQYTACPTCHMSRHGISHVHQKKLSYTILLCKNCHTAERDWMSHENTKLDVCHIILQQAVNDIRTSCERELKEHQTQLELALKREQDATIREYFPDKKQSDGVFREEKKRTIQALEALILALTPTLVEDTARRQADDWRNKQAKLRQTSEGPYRSMSNP